MVEIFQGKVIEVSRTKPFGFQAFYPGPGLGGHCIPVDPFYLTWKAREFDFHTIELAGEINTYMPYFVVEKVANALNDYIPVAPITIRYKLNKRSVDLTAENLKYDCVVVVTDHSLYNPDFILENANLIVDTRNLIKVKSEKVVKS